MSGMKWHGTVTAIVRFLVVEIHCLFLFTVCIESIIVVLTMSIFHFALQSWPVAEDNVIKSLVEHYVLAREHGHGKVL